MPFLTPITQTFPIPGQVSGLVFQDAQGVSRAATYNQSISGGRAYLTINTAVTTMVSNAPGRVCRVHVVGNAVGNLTLYDNATTASGTVLFNRSLNGNEIIDLQIPVANGIVAVTTATDNLLITWE